MKKLLITCTLFTSVVNAQNINFLDANLKSKLVNSIVYDQTFFGNNMIAKDNSNNYIKIDANSDGEIQVSEALNVYSLTLEPKITPSTQIVDLTGLENFINLTELNFRNNLISSFDFSPLTKLKHVDGGNNLLKEIDLSQASSLNYLAFENNQVESVNVKNGSGEGLNYWGNPNFKYLCQDDNQLDTISNLLNMYPNLSINSYCSFTPGGNFNTLTGKFIFDADNNGCDASDPSSIQLQKINILNNGIINSAVASNHYSLYEGLGTYLITPINANPSIFTYTPNDASITFTNNQNNTISQDFCITSNGIHPDLEIVIVPSGVAKPGFGAGYNIVYKNKGNQIQSGDIQLNYDNKVYNVSDGNNLAVSNSNGTIKWNYNALKPFESRMFYIHATINSPADVNPVNIGDILTFTASINPSIGDETQTDNSFIFNQTVVGAYDPNIVTCLEGTEVSDEEIGNYLHYTVDFENTGNYPAENIVVKEILDETKYDINTLQILNSSNPMNVKITGNKIEYIFENIQLQANQHGNLLMKTKTLPILKKGDDASRSADIYFDYNLPVKTNDEKTTFNKLTTGLELTSIDQTITIFPNPSNGIFNIKSENQTDKVEVFDASGRLLIMKIGSDNSSKVDITNQEQGIYFLKITTDKGVKVMEVIKN